MHPTVHPDHEGVVQTVRGWIHGPHQGMGYRAERRRWGTYWSTQRVYVEDLPVDHVDAFLADLRDYYEDRPVYVNVDDRALDADLGPALLEAGCVEDKIEVFLVHVGPVLAAQPVPGLRVEPVTESNLETFVETKLQGFADDESQVAASDVAEEVAQRRAELMGTARGRLARMEGEPAGVIWWYEEDPDRFIVLMATRARFRRRGIAGWLLSDCLQRAYDEDFRSVMLNVRTDNEKALSLYHRLGFQDEVHWRHRYRLEAEPNSR